MNIIVNLQVEGLHCWPNAPKMVAFLRQIHRHIFHIEIEKEVLHDDRETEIIMFKREVLLWLHDTYYRKAIGMHNFGDDSCEMIARELGEGFYCESVKVLEDNENGAIWRV